MGHEEVDVDIRTPIRTIVSLGVDVGVGVGGRNFERITGIRWPVRLEQMPLLGCPFDEDFQFTSHETGDSFDVGAKTTLAEAGNRWANHPEVPVASIGEVHRGRQKSRSGT